MPSQMTWPLPVAIAGSKRHGTSGDGQSGGQEQEMEAEDQRLQVQ